MRTRAIAVAACLVTANSMSAGGQSQPQPAPKCEDVLLSPTRDSTLVRVMLSVHAYDRERDLSDAVQYEFGDAMLKHLVLPRPLAVDAYQLSGDTSAGPTAHLALRGSYAAVLTSDGRVGNPLVTGGAHNFAFDVAVLAALRAIDSTDLRSLVTAVAPRGEIPIRLEITTRDSAGGGGPSMLPAVVVSAVRAVAGQGSMSPPSPGSPPAFAPDPAEPETAMPLFSFRVPARPVTSRLAVVPGVGLKYPANRRQSGTTGQSRMGFVVDPEGLAEQESIQVINATGREFADAVLDAMPLLRYRPLNVSGCAVRALAEQPFQFYVAR